MFHIQVRLIVQQSGLNVRAQLLELLHGDVVEGGHEHLVLHLAGADLVDDPLLQPLVEHLVVFQFHVQQHLRLLAEVQQLAEGPDVLPGEFRGLPGADIQGQQLVIGHVLDEAGAVGGALHGGVVEDHQPAVLGDVDIAFNAVGVCLFHCHAESQGAVFRIVPGKSAVCEQKGPFHKNLSFFTAFIRKSAWQSRHALFSNTLLSL